MQVMSTDSRNRVHKGVSTGGQFATKHRSEANGVALASHPPVTPDPRSIEEQVGAKVAIDAAEDVKYWKDRFASRYSEHWDEDVPKDLHVRQEKASRFSSLSPEERLEVAGEKYQAFLAPNQSFGNERVMLDQHFSFSEEDALTGLQAQKAMADSGIPGDITFTHLENGRAMFKIDDQGLEHEITIHDGYVGVRSHDESSLQNEAYEWGEKFDAASYSGRWKDDAKGNIGDFYEEQHRYAMALDVISRSPLAATASSLHGLDPQFREVEVHADGNAFTLDLSQSNARIISPRGDELPGSMMHGYMDEFAKKNDLGDGEKVIEALREVFNETDRRLKR